MTDTASAEGIAANRELWDAWTTSHLASDFYDVEGFLAGRSRLKPLEVEEVGPVDGLDLVHLQCHFGLDTLSWARLGARVTGVDFSSVAIEAARDLGERAGLDATFVEASVDDARNALDGEFDVVVTGYGALNWLPDMGNWAEVVTSLLRPGGFLHLVEFHPMLFVFADGRVPAFERPYFHRSEPVVFEESGSYADPDAPVGGKQHEWNHPTSDVVTALVDAGLTLEFFHEHPAGANAPVHSQWLEWLVVDDDGRERAPHDALPMLYSLKARRPD